MACVLRPTIVSVVVLASMVSACAGGAGSGSPGATGTAGSETALSVQVSPMFLTVQNLAGQPLLDVSVSIQLPGPRPPFTPRIHRLETGEKRDISFGDCSGRSGTRFNLRLARPREVSATAVDLVGTKYDVKVPWN